MVPFAGYDMPVQYPMGIMGEHSHTREAAGLFDVSHMGQVILSGAPIADIAAAFEETCTHFQRGYFGPQSFESRATHQIRRLGKPKLPDDSLFR